VPKEDSPRDAGAAPRPVGWLAAGWAVAVPKREALGVVLVAPKAVDWEAPKPDGGCVCGVVVEPKKLGFAGAGVPKRLEPAGAGCVVLWPKRLPPWEVPDWPKADWPPPKSDMLGGGGIVCFSGAVGDAREETRCSVTRVPATVVAGSLVRMGGGLRRVEAGSASGECSNLLGGGNCLGKHQWKFVKQ
jgi:hypothetical protein